MFLEEIISRPYRNLMFEIERTDDWSFGNLVIISGLDPEVDFRFLDLAGLDLRGEDLRGFNFSGSDLRGCLRNSKTVIDETTVFMDAKLAWLDVDEPQIVTVMAEVEGSRDHSSRRRKLSKLSSDFRSPNHVRIYLRNLIDTTRSVDAFFDYLDFFEPMNAEDVQTVASGLTRFSELSVKQAGRTRRYLSPSVTSFRRLLDRISESSNPIAQDAFNRYLKKLDAEGRTDRNSNHDMTDRDFSKLMVSISEAGGQSTMLFD
jgi:hypothetical protein